MYKAFGWAPPTFAHVSLLTDNARQKLSKRMGSSGIGQLREDGIFPEALVNHLALLGWSHRVENDFLPMADLISFVSLPTSGMQIVTTLTPYSSICNSPRALALQMLRSSTIYRKSTLICILTGETMYLKAWLKGLRMPWTSSLNKVAGTYWKRSACWRH